MILTCPRCKNRWDYRGKKTPQKEYTVWVACPRCRTSVKLEEKEKKK